MKDKKLIRDLRVSQKENKRAKRRAIRTFKRHLKYLSEEDARIRKLIGSSGGSELTKAAKKMDRENKELLGDTIREVVGLFGGAHWEFDIDDEGETSDGRPGVGGTAKVSYKKGKFTVGLTAWGGGYSVDSDDWKKVLDALQAGGRQPVKTDDGQAGESDEQKEAREACLAACGGEPDPESEDLHDVWQACRSSCP